jgi:glycosyltransferase involved in cell wall biosynthesis
MGCTFVAKGDEDHVARPQSRKGPRAAMTPVISVIMPVRNGAEWLGEAVASIRAQDFGDFEFLIVDDGSDDATAAMLAGFAGADRRIRVIRQPPQGIVVALNNAIAAARAPYLARLDADDCAMPNRLAKQLAFLQAHDEVGLLGSSAEEIDAGGAIIGRILPPADSAHLVRVLGRTNPFIHSSVMMRTALVRRLGGYRAAFRAAEDYDLWLRLAEVSGVANLAEDLVRYRRHGSNLSLRDAIRQSFSVRLAQRSAAARRSGAADPAASLAAPPDWWAVDAERSFYAGDVGLYRFLDSDAVRGPGLMSAVRQRLFELNHVERRLAQARLQATLREPGLSKSPRHLNARRLYAWALIAALYPPRALGMAWRTIFRSAGRRNGAERP